MLWKPKVVPESDDEKMLKSAIALHGHDWNNEWKHGDFPRYTKTYVHGKEAEKYEDEQSDGIPSAVAIQPCFETTTPLPCDLDDKEVHVVADLNPHDDAADKEVHVTADLNPND